ncbi:unnamed protein product [Sphagnum jensenii]|uniref:Uncharacterized protein n=1 Tax=Sphagnum jensenii TaxID=128206 RepID=A0ABP1BNF6_9BRYO
MQEEKVFDQSSEKPIIFFCIAARRNKSQVKKLYYYHLLSFSSVVVVKLSSVCRVLVVLIHPLNLCLMLFSFSLSLSLSFSPTAMQEEIFLLLFLYLSFFLLLPQCSDRTAATPPKFVINTYISDFTGASELHTRTNQRKRKRLGRGRVYRHTGLALMNQASRYNA